MTTHADYPAPTIIAATTGTGLQPNIIDTTPFRTPGYPPVVEIYISATATVYVWGALSLSTTNPATLQFPVNIAPGGAVTASDFYDLVVGIPFWQFEVAANTGTVTILCGPSPSEPDTVATPSLVRMTTNATDGM